MIATRPSDGAAVATRVFVVHGFRIGLRSDAPAVTDVVSRSYDAFQLPDPAGDAPADVWIEVQREGRVHRLTVDGGEPSDVRDELHAILGTLDRIVMAVLRGLGQRGILGTHAGAVAIDGRSVLLAGPSGRGKSTLTLAMLRQGAALLTDELALIAADQRTILPYPRALHVSPETVDLVPGLELLRARPRQALGGESEWSLSVGDLCAAFGTMIAQPTPLGAVVLLGERVEADMAPRIEPVTAAVATMELLRGTPAAVGDFAGTMRRLGTIASAVPIVRLHASDPVRTAGALFDHVARLR